MSKSKGVSAAAKKQKFLEPPRAVEMREIRYLQCTDLFQGIFTPLWSFIASNHNDSSCVDFEFGSSENIVTCVRLRTLTDILEEGLKSGELDKDPNVRGLIVVPPALGLDESPGRYLYNCWRMWLEAHGIINNPFVDLEN